jgi:hypothetical protein
VTIRFGLPQEERIGYMRRKVRNTLQDLNRI